MCAWSKMKGHEQENKDQKGREKGKEEGREARIDRREDGDGRT